jgi:hypothetical protein
VSMCGLSRQTQFWHERGERRRAQRSRFGAGRDQMLRRECRAKRSGVSGGMAAERNAPPPSSFKTRIRGARGSEAIRASARLVETGTTSVRSGFASNGRGLQHGRWAEMSAASDS